MTTEISGEVTGDASFTLHTSLGADVELNNTDRIVIKFFANVSGGGSNVTVVLYQEGNTTSHFSMPTSTDILNDLYLRQIQATTLLSDLTVSGVKRTLTAGENLVFGDFCYRKNDGKLWKANATILATSSGFIYMAAATIAADATGLFLKEGIARDDSWTWTEADLLYVSTVAGTLQDTPPGVNNNNSKPVAQANGTTHIELWQNLNNIIVVTP